MMRVSWVQGGETRTRLVVAWCNGDAIILVGDHFERAVYSMLHFLNWVGQ